MSEREVNQRIADEICGQLRLNGRQFHRGEFVALLDGKVVAVEPNLDAALQALRALEADPHRGMIFEVGPQDIDVVRCGRENTRLSLLTALAELSRLRPEWRLGQAIANIATSAGRMDSRAAWDLEDAEALAAARNLIDQCPELIVPVPAEVR